jgi:glutamate N-acetyltransferase/amino-acid acetyltransferase
VVNAGQANACTGEQGLKDCRHALNMTAETLQLSPDELLPASTGVIGDRIKQDRWEQALPALGSSLSKASALEAARTVMTTDKYPKMAWRSLNFSSGEVRILGMAKGAGMICPNMATMLGFIICDAEVDQTWWRGAVATAVEQSFNRITVDGDTSTNDCVLALANGRAGKAEGKKELNQLPKALVQVCAELAGLIVQDAEGGAKIIHVRVSGAKSTRQAKLAARAVGHSPLVKTAMYGQDPTGAGSWPPWAAAGRTSTRTWSAWPWPDRPFSISALQWPWTGTTCWPRPSAAKRCIWTSPLAKARAAIPSRPRTSPRNTSESMRSTGRDAPFLVNGMRTRPFQTTIEPVPSLMGIRIWK